MLGCLVYSDRLPDGMVAAGVSVHSHPATPDVYPTYMDRQLLAMRGYKGLIKVGMRNRGRAGFSVDDFEAGPGYLVVAGNVLFQAGRQAIRAVGRIEDPAPVRKFKRR
jgi:hypothetical protein